MSQSVVESTRASRRRGARATRAQYVLAADSSSIAELQTAITTLPVCATGRIFIEVAGASEIFVMPAPARMTVTWLDRSRRSGAPGTSRACAQGEALTRAVTAWADEMLCEESIAKTQAHVMAGYIAAADIVEHLTEKAGMPVERVFAPQQYGLTPQQ